MLRLHCWTNLPGRLCLVLDLAGETLAQVSAGGELCINRSVQVAARGLSAVDTVQQWAGVVAALQQVHARAVLHLDIKPENFLLVGRKLKLADFGEHQNIFI